MKHLMLTLGVMFVTFGLGVGIDRLIWRCFPSNTFAEDKVNPVPLPVVETSARLPPVNPPLPEQTPSGPSAPILNYSSKEFDLDGVYYWLGPQPKEFEDFRSLELLATTAPPGHPLGYMAWLYAVANDDHNNHPASFGLITDKRVFIILSQTSELNFEYHFEGEFVRKDFEAVAGKDKPVLRGTLTKYRDGRKVAKTTVSFRFEFMGC